MVLSWHKWPDAKPKEAGPYLVKRPHVSSVHHPDGKMIIFWSIDNYDYTPEGGWNTHTQDDGTVYADHALEFKGAYVWWAVPERLTDQEADTWLSE